MKRFLLLSLMVFLRGCGGPPFALAQVPVIPPPQSGSIFVASQYGQYLLYSYQGNAATGSSTIFVNGYNAQGPNVPQFVANLPLLLDKGTGLSETVTVSSVAICNSGTSNCVTSQICSPGPQLCAANGTFTHVHGKLATVQSGTAGLQEAINVALAQNGGTVLVDQTWGGVTSMITSVVKGSTSVVIQDNRSGAPQNYQWNGSAYVAVGGGAGAGVSSLNGQTGAVAITGDSTITVTPGSGTIALHSNGTGIQSINGDTTSAQQTSCGGGITCSTASGVTTFSVSGGGLTGAVNSAGNFALGAYPNAAAGTTIGGASAVSVPPPAASLSQLNTLFGNANAVILQPGSIFGFTNSLHNRVLLTGTNALAWSVQESGAWCDAVAITGQLSSSTNTVTGHSFSASDVGKSIMVVGPNGSGLMTRYIAVIQSVSGGNAVLTANSPLSTSSGWVMTLAHDDFAALTDAITFGSSTEIQVTLPAGRCFTSQPLAWPGINLSGQGSQGSSIIGPAGQDTFLAGGQNANIHMHDFALFVDAELDAADSSFGDNSARWQACDTSGTCTNQAGLYRPVGIGDAVASNPLNAQWITGPNPYSTGAINGVSTVTQSNAVMCVTSSVIPTVGQQIIFPYQAAGVDAFSTTVASTAGSCGSGTPITLTAAYTPAGGTQKEWFAGTSIQNIQTSIPSTGRTYPITVNLQNSIIPNPEFSRSGFGYMGVVEIGKEWFSYVKSSDSPAAISTSPTIYLQASIQTGTASAGYEAHSIGDKIFPLNPCIPTQPFPVVPTLNANDTTPSGAEMYPAACVGNAAISFPVVDGNSYSGSLSPPDQTWNNLYIAEWPGNSSNAQNAIGFQVQNDTAGIYIVPGPFGHHASNIFISSTFYGIAEGMPSYHTHGYIGTPTFDGNEWDHISIQSAAYDLWIIDEGSSTWKNTFNFSQSGQAPNGLVPGLVAYSGGQGDTYLGGEYDDEVGGLIGNSYYPSFTHWDEHYAEVEVGPLNSLVPILQLDCLTCTYTNWNEKSGGLVYIGGINQIFTNGILQPTTASPVVNYGQYNTFNQVAGMFTGAGSNCNTWASCTFINWGPGTQASALNGTTGAQQIPLAGNSRQQESGQTGDTFLTGNVSVPYQSALSAFLTPDMFNNNGALDSLPMTYQWVFDDTAPVTRSYTACKVISGAGGHGCSVATFGGSAHVNIGTGGQIVPGKYLLYTAFKVPSGTGTVAFSVLADSPGSGCAASGTPVTLYSGSFAATTTWSTFGGAGAAPIVVDFTGYGGCYLLLNYADGGTTALFEQAYVDFQPLPVAFTSSQFILPGGQSWSSGSGAPGGSCPSAAFPVGSLYSNTSGTPNALYVCQSGGWVGK